MLIRYVLRSACGQRSRKVNPAVPPESHQNPRRIINILFRARFAEAWDARHQQPESLFPQARAIFEAATDVQKKGIKVKPEVMIPLVGFKKELDLQVAIVHRVAAEVQKEKKVKLSYQVGTMIEVPRGALTPDTRPALAGLIQQLTEKMALGGVSADQIKGAMTARAEAF